MLEIAGYAAVTIAAVVLVTITSYLIARAISLAIYTSKLEYDQRKKELGNG